MSVAKTVISISEAGNRDLTYNEIFHCIEIDIEAKNIPEDS